MGLFRKRKRRWTREGKHPAKRVSAWPGSSVYAVIWINGDNWGRGVFTYTIRVKVAASRECPSGYSTVFTGDDLIGVAMCAIRVRRIHRQWKSSGIVR